MNKNSNKPAHSEVIMSSEEWLDQADDEYQYGSATHIAKGYAAYFHAAQMTKSKPVDPVWVDGVRGEIDWNKVQLDFDKWYYNNSSELKDLDIVNWLKQRISSVATGDGEAMKYPIYSKK